MLTNEEIRMNHREMLKLCRTLQLTVESDSDLKETFDRNIYTFLCDIAGEPNDSEIEFIGEFGKDCADKAVLDTAPKKMNDGEIPEIIRFFVEIENKYMDAGITKRTVESTADSMTVALFRLFAIYGSGFLVCDRELTDDEAEKFTSHMKAFQKYIYANLKKTDFNSALRIAMTITADEKPCDTIIINEAEKGSDIHEFPEVKIPRITAGNKAFGKAETSSSGSSLSELMDKLNDLVGLDDVKCEVAAMISLVKIQKLREERGMKQIPMSYHMVFTGNPGTGKTTIARLLSEIYRELGVLSKGSFGETDRSGLVAGYLGQTALKVQEKVKAALGGILFIDEAYSLASSDHPSDYGREAIDTLVKAMEDNRDDLIVIVAGYTEPMKRFINSNPGLRSRFNKYLVFPDYQPEELTEIFIRMCSSNGYKLSDNALVTISERFRKMYENRDETFGNGRDVRNIFERAVTRQALRLSGISSPANDEILTFEVSDVE